MSLPAPEPSAIRARTAEPHSLGRRLVLATLGFCLLFTVATVGVRTWFAWQANQDGMTAELQLIDQVFQRTLSKAIWEMDREALESQLESVVQSAPVGRAELRILRAGREPEVFETGTPQPPGSTSRAPFLQHELVFEPYEGAREPVGSLRLEGNEALLWKRLLNELVSIVLTQVIQSLLLAGLIMWLFHRSVTVHVRHIAQHLGQLSPSTLRHPLQLERAGTRQDELALLERGVNDVQDKLSVHIERQREYEKDLAAHRDHLAELVEAQTAELRTANARLEDLTRSDPLTGLANRRQFDEIKEIEFRRALRSGQPLSVLMCDIDFFKRYNDGYGHNRGDHCLQQVAQVLRATFARAGEVAARLGGEEFAVLLPGSDGETARVAAERLRAALAERAIPHADSDAGPSVTLSIGLAELKAETMDHFDQLLHAADQALYRAKRQGRNQVMD